MTFFETRDWIFLQSFFNNRAHQSHVVVMRHCFVLTFHCIRGPGIVKSASKHAVLLGGEWTDRRHFTPRTIRTVLVHAAFYFSQFLETINQPRATQVLRPAREGVERAGRRDWWYVIMRNAERHLTNDVKRKKKSSSYPIYPDRRSNCDDSTR